MEVRTTGPRQENTTLRGYATPFVNFPFTAETLTAKLAELETAYKANPITSRSEFVKSQLALILGTYAYFSNALNQLSTQNLGVSAETILSAATTAATEYVPEPFGVLVKGFTYLFTKIGAQSLIQDAIRIQKDQTYYVGQLNQLQALYTTYQAELNRILLVKFLLVGVPAFLLFLANRKKNGTENTGT